MQLHTLLTMMTRKIIIVVNIKLIDLDIRLVLTITKHKVEINKKSYCDVYKTQGIVDNK